MLVNFGLAMFSLSISFALFGLLMAIIGELFAHMGNDKDYEIAENFYFAGIVFIVGAAAISFTTFWISLMVYL